MQSIILYGLKQLATLVSGLGKKKKLFILIFHRVLDEPDFMRPGEVDKHVFSWQMQLLAKYFNVLPLADALERLDKGELPSRAVCITFDDGYADNYLNALPILKQHNFSATFFIATGYLNGGTMWNDQVIETLRNFTDAQLDLRKIKLGIYNTQTETEKLQAAEQIILQIKHFPPRQRMEYTAYIASFDKGLSDELMMTDEQLVKLYQSGMEIGGHTVTHPIMAKISGKQLKTEILDNKNTLRALLNTDIRFFAYPNGKLGQDYLFEHVNLIKGYGYQAAVSTQWGVTGRDSDRFQLPRFTPWDQHPVKFMGRLIMSQFYGKNQE